MRIAPLICPLLLAARARAPRRRSRPPSTRDPPPRQRPPRRSTSRSARRAAEHPDPRLRDDPPRREARSDRRSARRSNTSCACSRRSDAGTNAVYTILFAFGSTDVMVPRPRLRADRSCAPGRADRRAGRTDGESRLPPRAGSRANVRAPCVPISCRRGSIRPASARATSRSATTRPTTARRKDAR
jgi:hypothetical protein